MKVRIIDYVASFGGGVRFTVEMIRALRARSGLSFEVVSHGVALERYQGLLSSVVAATFLDIPPRHAWRGKTLLAGIPGAGPLNWLLGTPVFEYTVGRPALEDCDLAWFPWLHRHRIPWDLADRVVASLHDVIIIDFPDMFPRGWAENERQTVSAWLGSSARIAVSSRATAASLTRIFGSAPGRVSVIPLSGQHGEAAKPAEQPRAWPFSGRDYLLCPANLSRHKNHEVLIAGAASVAARHPIVLTGEGADLRTAANSRVQTVRAAAEAAGLVPEESLFAVGYVNDSDYYRILDGAWAVVMPTLAEGGGSFPVLEAMVRGIPVVASDIPVMREMVERAGGEVLWFDPHDPGSLARVLAELEGDYPRLRTRAAAQAKTLRTRTWAQVAEDYAGLMELPGEAAGGGGNA
jgi:glycosyltransferase involved in cell wall biosynthesis